MSRLLAGLSDNLIVSLWQNGADIWEEPIPLSYVIQKLNLGINYENTIFDFARYFSNE